MRKIILQPRKSRWLKWLKWEIVASYEDGSEWFKQGYKTRQEAFGEAFNMCNLRKDRELVYND